MAATRAGAASRSISTNEILLNDVKVNGRAVRANLDTGSNSTFQLTPTAVAALGLEAQVSQGAVTESVGINGASVHRAGYVDEIALWAITIAKPAACSTGKNGGHDDEARGVRIGNRFLKDYAVTIDYPHSRLSLEGALVTCAPRR